MSEWIDCPKCGFNHENLTACPPPVIRKSEYDAECLSEIPKEITAAAILISRWMSEQGHQRWELFDLCSRNHAHDLETCMAKLEAANKKLADASKTLGVMARLIDISKEINNGMTDAEIAGSATFSEALAYTNAEMLEGELKEWKAVAAMMALALMNDGMRANNPLSHIARSEALKAYDKLKGE